jgi:hypothetical protein
MKTRPKTPETPQSFSRLNPSKYLAACFGLACALFASNTKAAVLYFDPTGTTAPVSGSTYTWDTVTTGWATTHTLTATPIVWNSADAACFTASSSFSGTITVDIASSGVTCAGIYNGALTPDGVTLTIAGPGALTVKAGIDAFDTYGSDLAPTTVTAQIIGPGEIESEGSDSLFLYGNNTYSGGTIIEGSGGININNNNSLGTGPIIWDTAAVVLADLTATGPLTLANGMSTVAGDEMIVITANTPNTAITFSGPWTNAAGGVTRLTTGNSTYPASAMTISGPLYGGPTANILKDGPGRLVLNTADTNAETIVATNGVLEIGASGSFAGTLDVTNISGGLQLDADTALTPACVVNLGSTLAANAIDLAFTGQDTVKILTIGGVIQSPGTYGSSTSSAANQLSIFTGNGVLTVPNTPVIVQQPQSAAIFTNGTANFTVVASGAALNYQWYSNSSMILGANGSTYTISPAVTNDSATYYVHVSNTAGSANSSNVTLNVVIPDFYAQTIISNNPVSYWLLNEAAGSTAFDYIGTNNGTYVNVTLDQPGFSSLEPSETSIGMPANSSARAYMQVANGAPFNDVVENVNSFTLEAWACFTNLSGTQRIISTFDGADGYAWGIDGASELIFTQDTINDYTVSLPSALVAGTWYHFAMVCDGYNYNFYLNGVYIGQQAITTGYAVVGPFNIGAHPTQYPYSVEQVLGYVAEVAFYSTALSPSTVLGDYNARYGMLTAPGNATPAFTSTGTSTATNYATLTSVVQTSAAGQDLSYQWFFNGNLISGATSSALTIPGLTTGNSGSYSVRVSNPMGTNLSPNAVLTVLPIPTTSTQLNLTNGLVLHLPFNGNYNDISGQGNNGTAVGSPSFVSPAAVGSKALAYSSTTSPASYNYVSLGVVPDLQFGSTTNFSVSMWVLQPAGSSFTNLPFFTDATGSTTTTTGGFAFAPYEGPAGTTPGGCQWGISSTTYNIAGPSTEDLFTEQTMINDGNWHNLVFVANRSASLTLYVDGVAVNSSAIEYIGDIDTTNATTIGQDPTGTYAVTASGEINDLAVWTRTLSQLEVSGIYLAGINNGVSFAPVVTPPPAQLLPFSITNVVSATGNVTLTWQSVSNHTYSVQVASSLATNTVWTTVASNITATTALTSYTASNTNTAAYYQVVGK